MEVYYVRYPENDFNWNVHRLAGSYMKLPELGFGRSTARELKHENIKVGWTMEVRLRPVYVVGFNKCRPHRPKGPSACSPRDLWRQRTSQRYGFEVWGGRRFAGYRSARPHLAQTRSGHLYPSGSQTLV